MSTEKLVQKYSLEFLLLLFMSQKLEISQISTKENKQVIIYSCNKMLLLQNLKTIVIQIIHQSHRHNSNQKKPDTEGHDSIHMDLSKGQINL